MEGDLKMPKVLTKQNKAENANGSEWNEINMDKAGSQPATCLSSHYQVAYKYQSEIDARSNSIYVCSHIR